MAPASRILPDVKNIIAVSSGKGGVGKSTITANLAVALANEGYRVGLLDADIYGPSQPRMFRVEGTPSACRGGGQRADRASGELWGEDAFDRLFVNPEDAILWRGTMASNALGQMITEGHWGELDYLLIDLPQVRAIFTSP